MQGRSPNSLDFQQIREFLHIRGVERFQLLQALYIASVIIVNSKLYQG